jgi:hypothetical protein
MPSSTATPRCPHGQLLRARFGRWCRVSSRRRHFWEQTYERQCLTTEGVASLADVRLSHCQALPSGTVLLAQIRERRG